MFASIEKMVKPISSASHSTRRCFIRKNSAVPCVASPSATMRASPITAFSGCRSSNPEPARSVSNGMAFARSHSSCSALGSPTKGAICASGVPSDLDPQIVEPRRAFALKEKAKRHADSSAVDLTFDFIARPIRRCLGAGGVSSLEMVPAQGVVRLQPERRVPWRDAFRANRARHLHTACRAPSSSGSSRLVIAEFVSAPPVLRMRALQAPDAATAQSGARLNHDATSDHPRRLPRVTVSKTQVVVGLRGRHERQQQPHEQLQDAISSSTTL